ncbi:MAG: NAD(+)/NADH kinase [Lachnospiraceae bacterium]|nr:NAD(+)/NADH kinase [Lachnospiraceae bacterium]
MKRFCVITNRDKEDSNQKAVYIREYLEQKGGKCCILENRRVISEGILHYTDADKIPEETECALVLGGDGTMIQAAIDLVHSRLPILGINMGTVGFLTEVEQQNLEHALDLLLADKYTIENRIMLRQCGLTQSDAERGKACYALNDVVLSKRGDCRLITIKVYINNELADIYRADGLIISTPTGSTGYNLSAGGPVMVPDTEATVITPICAHSLNKRSLVVSARDRIVLELGQTKEFQEDTAVLVVDGRTVRGLSTGERLEICVPEDQTRLIKLSGLSFYKKMRDKLNGN